ncbi:MAG: LacI family transcriptional regulator, partial [Variovorax paradoxus]
MRSTRRTLSTALALAGLLAAAPSWAQSPPKVAL